MIGYEGKNRRAVNYLRTIYFDGPEWTPCSVGILPAAWMRRREAMERVVLAHPRVFPGFEAGSVDFDFPRLANPRYEPGRHTDCWGVVWGNVARGMASHPVGHPLEDWANFERWKRRLPDPMTDDIFGPRRDWADVEEGLRRAKERGDLARGHPLPHGFFFMNLFYLRGFENFMVDLATDEPRLHELADILLDYNMAVIRRYLQMGVEVIGFGEDLGMQNALPISPAAWRRFLKPYYEEMFGICRDRGVPVYLHTDGHVLEVIPDLIETGVRVLNPQIRGNGVEGLRRTARGKVALDQDLDRQLFPLATPAEVVAHVEKVFEGLYLQKGGLMLKVEIGPDVPLENVEAICRALERLCRLPEPE